MKVGEVQEGKDVAPVGVHLMVGHVDCREMGRGDGEREILHDTLIDWAGLLTCMTGQVKHELARVLVLFDDRVQVDAVIRRDD